MTTSNNLQEAVNRHLATNHLTPKALGQLVGLSDWTIRKVAKTGTATKDTVEKLSTQIDSAWMAAAVADFFPENVPVTLDREAIEQDKGNPLAGLDAEPTFEDTTPKGTTTASLDEFPGAVSVSKNRRTKTRIVIIDRGGVRANPKDLVKRWEVRCIDHAATATTGDRAVANYGAASPWGWCKKCRALAPDAQVKFAYPDQPHRVL